jgi:hypothetical protein
MTKERMKRFRLVLAIAVLTSAAAAPAAWDGNAFTRDAGPLTQAQWQKGGGGGRQGGERGGPPPDRGGREMRQDRHDDRRGERMSEDDRRSLHRDLDKANRELYGRRSPK